jgi:2-iminobutanoate/2-iminopropanoate deaminase
MSNVYKSSEGSTAPLSGAREANGLVYVSGQVHLDAEGTLSGTTIEEKFDLVITNIKNILKEAGLGLDDVIRVQLYLTDLSELPALNKAYVRYFAHPLPARTAIGVKALPLGASLEMDAIAAR